MGVKDKSVEVRDFNNIQIITREKDKWDGNRQGVDWWTESQAMSLFQHAKKDGDRQRYWNTIIKETPIRSMKVVINGSGDSGGIEDFYLYDENEYEISAMFKVKQFHMLKNKTDAEWEKWSSEHKSTYGDQTKFVQLNDDKATEYELSVEGRKKCMQQYIEAMEDNWELHSINRNGDWNSADTYIMYKSWDSADGYNDWGYQDSVKLNLQFPSCNTYDRDAGKNRNAITAFLNSLYYGILPGGWEINEGSMNELQISNVEKDGENYPKIQVSHIYYREEHEEFEFDSMDFLSYFNNITKTKQTYNLDTKQGSLSFYRLVSEIESRRVK